MSEAAKASPKAAPKKKGFRLPHLFFLILIILMLCSLLTYIVPAGQFAADADGNLIGDQFSFLGYQTPVSPWQAINLCLTGLANSGKIIGLLLAAGGFSGVVLATKCIDNMIDFAIYKLKDKGVKILVPGVFLIYCFVGCFAGGDQIIAMVPIGLMFAKKLRLDPICGLAVVLFAYHVGGLSSPNYAQIPQMLMGVDLYSGFGVRVVIFLILSVIAMFPILKYANKVAADPHNSALPVEEWLPQCDAQVDDSAIKEVQLDKRSMWGTILFLIEPVLALICVNGLGIGQNAIVSVCIIMSIVIGFVMGFNMDQIGNAFAKGTAGMAFVGFVIGIAATLSLVMAQGNILHTIVYFACKPLAGLSKGAAAIGMSMVITVINLIIPSASAKAAVLCPIVAPMCQMLGINLQIGVQAFLYGDKLTNIISPVLGTTVAALGLANIPYNKWFKWVFPKIVGLAVVCWFSLYILTLMGWA